MKTKDSERCVGAELRRKFLPLRKIKNTLGGIKKQKEVILFEVFLKVRKRKIWDTAHGEKSRARERERERERERVRENNRKLVWFSRTTNTLCTW